VTRLPTFADLDVPAEMFPHSVKLSRASDATADPALGRRITHAPAEPAVPCLIEDATPAERQRLWAQDRLSFSHTVYFPADWGLVTNDLMYPQDAQSVRDGVFFRVVSSVNDFRTNVLWVVRCVEMRGLE
jgi:hypothetical protein